MSLITIIVIVAVIHYLLKRTILKNASGKKMMIISWAVGLSLIGLDQLRYYYGSETVGSFFEKGADYKTEYYVLMFPSQDKTKNYKVKAEIEATIIDEENRVYYINKAYMPNGGVITFQNSRDNMENDIGLRVGAKEKFTDDSGREWWIQLLPEKGMAFHKQYYLASPSVCFSYVSSKSL